MTTSSSSLYSPAIIFTFLLLIDVIRSECGYYAENGVAIPIDECQHYVGYDVSFEYSCTGNIVNGSDEVQFIVYKGNEHCSSQRSLSVDINYKYCNQDGITCNCEGNGQDCATLLWRFEDYTEFESGLTNECDSESFSEWTYVINECIPDNKGGSTKLLCLSDGIEDNVDDYRLVRYYKRNCQGVGFDITSDLMTNCTTVICGYSSGNQMSTTGANNQTTTRISNMCNMYTYSVTNITIFLVLLSVFS